MAAVIVAAMACSALAQPQLFRFDLGPAGSPLWKNYTPLTPASQYDSARGFGFVKLVDPLARQMVRPDPLRQDFISAKQVDLRVDLPKGDYRILLLSGDAQLGQSMQRFYFHRSISIDGRRVFAWNAAPADYFAPAGDYWKYYRAFWTPGMDCYDAMVAPHFQFHTFTARVDADHLDLQWTNLPVDAIMIAPQNDPAALKEMADLPAQLRQATTVQQDSPPQEPMPAINASDRQRGFILFRRPANEWVYPSTRPRDAERIDHLKSFAAPGQSQSVHFSLLPLRDLGETSISATNLKNGAAVIPASAVEIRVVRYIFQDAIDHQHAGDIYRYQIAPFALDANRAVPANSGLTWSWYATVRVPDDTPAGDYHGTLQIHTQNGPSFDLPLQLRILPIHLAALPIVEGYYYYPDCPFYAYYYGLNVQGASLKSDPAILKLITQNETRELAFMRDLGLNSVSLNEDLRNVVEYVDDQVRLKKDNQFTFWMDLYAKAGMGPMPFYGFHSYGQLNRLGAYLRRFRDNAYTPPWNKALRSFASYLVDLGRQHGWPEILIYSSDECSNGYGKLTPEQDTQNGLKTAEALQNLPGVRTIASMNGPLEHVLPAHLSISMPNLSYPISPQVIDMIHQGGSTLWLYNCGSERVTLGLYPWRVRAGGRFQWMYHTPYANPWNDLDGQAGETYYSIVLPGPHGPIATLRAEAVRAATNDLRYIATLQQAIASSKNREKAAGAQAFLDKLRSEIPVDLRKWIPGKNNPSGTGKAISIGPFKDTDHLDDIRRQAAQWIVELQ